MKSVKTYDELQQQVEALEMELKGCKERNGDDSRTPQYLEEIINKTNLPIYLKDANYNYILVNKQYELLAHVTEDQIKGKSDFDIFPEPVARLFRSQDEEVVERLTLVEFEETIPLPDGIHTFLTAKFPLIDSKGQVYAVGGVCTDITAQKKIEEELKQAEVLVREGKERYKRLTENAQDMIFRMSVPDGNYEYVSPAVERISGYTPQELYESPLIITKIIHPDWHEHFEKQWGAILAGKMPETDEFPFVHKSGEVRWVSQRNVIVKDDSGLPIALEAIVTDITEQKLASEALQKAHDELEQHVAERTLELYRRSERLEQANVALRVLLEKRKRDKEEIEETVMSNIEKLIIPYLKRLKAGSLDTSQKDILEIIQKNIDEITSSFTSLDYLSKLTPSQVQIANMIKHGRTTREIASALNISPSTVACQRQEIRKRLSLNKKKVNLRTALMTNTE